MEQAEYDLNALLGCCRRELAFRERCYPRWIERGTISEKKAAREIELMRQACDYFTDAVFRSVTGQAPPPALSASPPCSSADPARSAGPLR